MFVIVFAGYVMIVNRNSKHMTLRQKILKAVYPAWMWWGKLAGKNTAELSNRQKQPSVSFYSLKSLLNDGTNFNFSTLKGKKVLLVNTASDCGYTSQYSELEKLYQQESGRLVILAFPANDFKEQEKGSDSEIAEFCKLNYGITFPLMSKSTVVKGRHQHEVFRWLTDSSLNGWNNKQPGWNFTKYLVDEEGRLVNYFGSSISPLGKELKNAINK
jgi:glutathione peroxidase